MKYPYLVVTVEEYTDPTGVLTHPDGDPGGDGWMEFTYQRSVVLGTYYGQNKNEAIKEAAEKWEVSPEVLDAYELTNNHSPLFNAVVEEIYYIINEKDPDYWLDSHELIVNNIQAIAESITDSFMNFEEEVEALLENEVKHNEYE